MRERRALVTVLLAALVATAALALPRQAHAIGDENGVPMWHLVATATIVDDYSGEDTLDPNFSYTDNSCVWTWNAHMFKYGGWKALCSIEWADPPDNIRVGHEDDVAMRMRISAGDAWHDPYTPEPDRYGSITVEGSFYSVENYNTVNMEWGGIAAPSSGDVSVNYAPGGSKSTRIEIPVGTTGQTALFNTFGTIEWADWTFGGTATMYPEGMEAVPHDTYPDVYYYGHDYGSYRLRGSSLYVYDEDLPVDINTTVALRPDLAPLPSGTTPSRLGTEQLLEGYNVVDGTEYGAFGLIIRVSASGAQSGYHRLYFYEYVAGEVDKPVVTVDTTPKEEGGEDEDAIVIPDWIIGATVAGIAVVGVGGALINRSKNKGEASREQPQPQAQEQQVLPSTFRMVLWKDFGNTLTVGLRAQMVGARIEEIKPGGEVVFRNDLTQRITFSVSSNLRAEPAGMQGPYQCINVEAVSCRQQVEDGVVQISFDAGAGILRNNVHFKVRNLEIVFAPIGLAFVAGENQRFQMPFRLSSEELTNDPTVKFSCRLVTPEAAKHFRDVRVVRDEVFPDKGFAVEMTQFGERENLEPGTIETYTCEVTAVVPAPKQGMADTVIKGTYNFFRFFEGVRMSVEHLKCYYVPYKENDDYLVDGVGALKGAASAQANALSGAAGVSIPGMEWQTEAAIRTTAREVKNRFPELWSEENVYIFDKRDKTMLEPARTHVYLTLYVVDEFKDKDGYTYRRPASRLPKSKDDVTFAFMDVPGSNIFKDKDGNDIDHPVEKYQFRYYIHRIDRTDNTIVYDVLPTKGVMLPPNRAQAAIGVQVVWKDRKFIAKEVVNVISQPYRWDLDERWEYYDDKDQKEKQQLWGIQRKIMGISGKEAAQGSFSLYETGKDVFLDQFENAESFARRLNPVTGLYDMGKSAYNSYQRQTRTVYYDNMMPIYHYIEMMLKGYDEHYGFCEEMYQKVVYEFAKFELGQIGAAEAIDDVYHGRDMEFGDALAMTVRDWNHSYAMIFARIGLGIVTAGQSEYIFIPVASIAAGMEASINYIDAGGDSLLEAYRVGCDVAGRRALYEVTFAVAINVGIAAISTCFKGAKILIREVYDQRQLFKKALKEMFSTGKQAEQAAKALSGVKGTMAAAEREADRMIGLYREFAQAGKGVDREIAYTLGRVEGSAKVDVLKKMMSSGKRMTIYERNQVILAIQSDKHAMRAMMEATGPEADAVKAFFSRSIKEIEEKALHMSRVKLVDELRALGHKGITFDKIRVKGTSGNAPGKVSMDLDATFQYLDDATGQWVDVKSAIGQETFNREFYKVAKGFSAESDDVAGAFARQADMTITDAWHPEAYSPDYQDALRVIDKTRAGEAFTHAEQVGKVAEYKVDHWLDLAKRARADADAAYKASRAAEAAGDAKLAMQKLKDAQKLASAAESFSEEGARQLTKQADRLIINKVLQMEADGLLISADVSKFIKKVTVVKRSGLGNYGGMGCTAGEIDVVLESGYGSSVEQLARELNELTVKLSNQIKAAKGA